MPVTPPQRKWRIENAPPRLRLDAAIGHALKAGWYAKLLFTSANATEYLWVKVVRATPSDKEAGSPRYVGIVQGAPPPFLYLERGSVVEFDPEQAFDYIDASPSQKRRAP